MRKIFGSSALAAATLILPMFASAATLLNTLALANTFLNALIGLFITLAIVVFFWGLIKYLSAVGDEKHKGLMIMFYGILTIFVMVALWGLVGFFAKTLNINPGTAAPAIQVPGQHYE